MNRTLMTTALAASAAALSTAWTAGDAAAQKVESVKVEVYRKQPYGEYLADDQGMSLYMFTADGRNASNCYDACAKAWPPLLAQGEPVAGKDVDASLLSTIERNDGANQVTYEGWPLYYYAKDQEPGDTKGQDVHGAGGEWYLVSPGGHKVEVEGSQSSS